MLAMPSVDDGRTDFSVESRQDAAVRVINVRGEIDLSTVAALQPEIEAALGARGPVVVDLCAATFLDSSGLYTLLVFRERLREQSRPLAIACWPDGAVGMAFRISGTDSVFDLKPTRDAAIEAATTPPAVPSGWSSDPVGRARRAAESALADAVRRLRSFRP
jgi:anti-anti-sigma factor